MRFEHLIRAVMARPWAIDPDSDAWGAVLDVLSMRAAGEVLSDAEITDRIAAAKNGPRRGRDRTGAVEVIPIYGIISPRATMMSSMSGGTTAEGLSAAIATAVADDEVAGIVLDIDSPGGAVEGVHELATEIRGYRGTKPIVAVANHQAASAAYWLASAADEIVMTPSGNVGSIGVISAHEDMSAQLEAKGVKTTLITAGKFKAEGHPFGPLDGDALAERQAKVDAFYRSFTGDVAKGRGVGVDVVRSKYGEGRTVLSGPALEAGMVDRIDSLDNTIRRVARGQVAITDDRAAALAARLAAPPVVATDPVDLGEELDENEEDAGEAGDEPTTPAPDPEEEARGPVIPALPVQSSRQRQRRLHEAALRVGLTLGSR